MGRKSGITSGGYDPRIWKMQWVMQEREVLREHSREQEQKAMNKKKLRRAYWVQRCANAMNLLKGTDPQGWERWFDDDANVPSFATHKDWSVLVEARIVELTQRALPKIKASLCRDIFVWHDHLGFFVYSKEEGKDTLYLIEFDSFEMAESFLRGLPIQNLGYGVVIDILPASAVTSNATVKA